MSFLTFSKFALALSAFLVLGSAVLLLIWGPKLSIDFTGGTLMQVVLPAAKTKEHLSQALAAYDPKGEKLGQQRTISAIRDVSGHSLLIRMRPIANDEHVALLEHLRKTFGDVRELQFTTIGPSVSASLKQKALVALVIASAALIVYLAFAFRKLPQKLNPWKFGILAVLAFLHDVLITIGIFAVIGRFTSFEYDPLFVTALLTILAYSANDTIVIFDRIRANMLAGERGEDFSVVVARGLKQCVMRTFGTTTAALIMLVTLFLLGSESIRWFILALIVGTIIGTYSSYFIAAPLLVYWK